MTQPDGFISSQTIEKATTSYLQAQTAKFNSLKEVDADQLLNTAIKNFVTLNENLTGNRPLNYVRASTAIHKLLDAILVAEKTYTKAAIRDRLATVRAIHRQSPFFVRTQDWPRGYAGDFETIEYIIKGENKAPQDSLGYYLESIILNSPIVQQHRNKVSYQANLILDKVLEIENPKVLSIGCGSSADLFNIQKILKDASIAITLFDMDEGALTCSAEKLDLIRDKCTLIQGNLLRLVKQINEQFDLILIGGVFDYLTDKTIVAVLKKIYNENLKPGGEIFFTNIASDNPYRTWMEYCFDWELIERSLENIQNIYEETALGNSAIAINRDETGLTLLARINKQ